MVETKVVGYRRGNPMVTLDLTLNAFFKVIYCGNGKSCKFYVQNGMFGCGTEGHLRIHDEDVAGWIFRSHFDPADEGKT
ncbi:hypothetical protein TSAR_012155 [Trichomalopsis sarcophagae]|uniref:Uncharacterized protein n=1 Tax=Trichomalopsis sarcophagae TaxID=543379 RepID=A0A232FKZ2_9HYME|nr:hypothetical protein TSAR_012155 [Trichomalopsis sarcophagae]